MPDYIKIIGDKYYTKSTGEPIIFSLHDLLKGGFQLTFKNKKIKPTLGATYYGIAGEMFIWDDFTICLYDKKLKWDSEKQAFNYQYPKRELEEVKPGEKWHGDKMIIGNKIYKL